MKTLRFLSLVLILITALSYAGGSAMAAPDRPIAGFNSQQPMITVDGAGQSAQAIGPGFQGNALPEPETADVVWIANSGDGPNSTGGYGSVSKLDARTGRELARYWVGLPGIHNDPSRTATDCFGNLWVANRAWLPGEIYQGSVTKILLAGGIDRNSNGVVDTSRDTNGDGVITPDEMLPLGEDERAVINQAIGVPGDLPRSIAVDCEKGEVWVGLFESKKYVILDHATGNLINDNVDNAGYRPYGAKLDRMGYLWSINDGDMTVTRIDTNTRAVVGTTAVPCFPYSINMDQAGNVWVGNLGNHPDYICPEPYNQGGVFRLDGHSGALMDFYLYPEPGAQSRGVAVDGDGNVWVTNTLGNNVARFDVATGTWGPTIPVGGRYPIGIGADDDYVWTVNRYGNNVTKISIRDYAEVGTYPVGASPYAYGAFVPTIRPEHPKGVAVDSQTNRVYVAFQGPEREVVEGGETRMVKKYPLVAVIDGTSHQVIKTISENPAAGLKLGREPVGVIYGAGKIYVTSFAENAVYVIQNDELVNRIDVGSQPMWPAFNPNTGKLYVPCHGDQTLAIIDTATDTEIKRLPLLDSRSRGPFAATVDPAVNMVFVTMRDAPRDHSTYEQLPFIIKAIDGNSDALRADYDFVRNTWTREGTGSPYTILARHASDGHTYLYTTFSEDFRHVQPPPVPDNPDHLRVLKVTDA
jgi:DNA-binding beta-propeller fold protein YncE